MSDTETRQQTGGSAEPSHTTHTAASSALNFLSNFPVPSSMKVSGDRANNWEFFRQQWEDYELATGLDKRPEAIRLANFAP